MCSQLDNAMEQVNRIRRKLTGIGKYDEAPADTMEQVPEAICELRCVYGKDDKAQEKAVEKLRVALKAADVPDQDIEMHINGIIQDLEDPPSRLM